MAKISLHVFEGLIPSHTDGVLAPTSCLIWFLNILLQHSDKLYSYKWMGPKAYKKLRVDLNENPLQFRKRKWVLVLINHVWYSLFSKQINITFKLGYREQWLNFNFFRLQWIAHHLPFKRIFRSTSIWKWLRFSSVDKNIKVVLH